MVRPANNPVKGTRMKESSIAAHIGNNGKDGTSPWICTYGGYTLHSIFCTVQAWYTLADPALASTQNVSDVTMAEPRMPRHFDILKWKALAAHQTSALRRFSTGYVWVIYMISPLCTQLSKRLPGTPQHLRRTSRSSVCIVGAQPYASCNPLACLMAVCAVFSPKAPSLWAMRH